ncbi:hypothetical protein Lal_00026985 [Lupinus albus]|nr:hypothetical protein Lal_00026985 [Lupinus albus]
MFMCMVLDRMRFSALIWFISYAVYFTCLAISVVTRTVEKGKAVGGMPKEDKQFECVTTTDYDLENMAYLTTKKRLASTALFEEQDLALAQMSSTKNVKHIDNE